MNLKLANVEEKHWDYIMELRNEFFQKYFDKQNEPLIKSQHYAYMKKQTENQNFHQWIATTNNNSLVGYVRILDFDINIMVNTKFQNKGFGTIILQLVEEKARKLGLQKLEAKVLTNNSSSKKIFEKNNFKHKLDYLEKIL